MCTAATAWEEEGSKGGLQEEAGCPRTPRSLRAPDTRGDREREDKVLPGRRTVAGQDKRSQ